MKNKISTLLLLLLVVFSRAGATVTITGPSLPCLGTSGIAYTASDGGGGTWSSSNTSRISINSTTGIAATGTLSGNLGPAVISYTPSGGGAVVTKSVTVSVVPDAIRIPTTGSTSLAPTITLCVSATNRLISNYPTVCTWSSTNSSVATVSSAGVLEAVGAGSATISYVHENGCYVTSAVTVPPVLTGKSITGTGSTPVVACEGGTLQLVTNASAGGTWSSADMSIATVGTSGVMLGQTKTGTNIEYTTIQYMVSGSCVAQQATVNPRPETITGVTAMCNSTTTPLYDVVSGGTWSSANVAKATVNATTGVVTAVSAGTARITYTGANGCFITRVQTVLATVSGSIAASSPYPSISVCYGMTVPLTISGQTGGTWSSTDASIGTIDNTTGIATGSIYSMSNQTTFIQYINASGCVSAVLTVNAVPPNITGTLAVCQGSTTTLSDASGGGTWSSSNTSVGTVGSSSGVVTGVAAGTTTITYTAATGCTTTAVVTVNPLPGSITGSSTICVGATTTYSCSGTGTWSSSNTGIATVNATTGVVTGNSAGTAIISYTLSSTGCFKTATVTVYPLASGTITGASSVCVGSTITLSEDSTGGTWSSSAPTTGSVSSSGVVSGLSAGTITISYTNTGYCGISSATMVITVNPLPDAGSISGSTSISGGGTVTLSDAVAGGTWSSSATSIATVGSTGGVTGIAAGTATITYTVTTGCGTAYTTTTVTVGLPPLSTPITGYMIVCPGDTLYPGNASWGGEWSSADSSIATISDAMIIGVSAGTVTISYIYSGMLATTTVTVHELASGTITGASIVCVGGSITLADDAEWGDWSSSASSVASVNSSGVVTGVSGGTATISFTATGYCGTSSATMVVTVNPLPDAGSISGSTSVSEGGTVTLSNAVTGGTWSSSATSIATVGSTGVVTGIAAGTATITYTVTAGCGTAYTTTTVTVGLPALSTPITGYLIVCPGDTLYPGNASWGGEWSSADSSIATVSGSMVIGVSAGTVTISYIYSGMLATTIVTVHALASGTITGASTVCVGGSITLADDAEWGDWSSSASGVASVNSSGVVTGVSGGTATISFTATGYCGTTSATKVITVNTTAPSPGTISGTTAIYVGDAVTLSDAAAGGVWSSSAPATATVSAAGLVTGVAAGIANISYTVSNGCSAHAIAAVSVNLPPLSTPITGYLVVCPGDTLYPGNASWGGTWISADTTIASISDYSIVGVSPGTVTISYIYSGMLATTTVTVHELASGTISGPANVGAGSTITLTDTEGGGTWSSSTPAVGSISSSGVVTGITAGITTISYTATGYCGTSTATYNVSVGTYCKIPMDASRWYQLNNTANGLQGLFNGVLDEYVNTGWGKILTNFDAYYPLLPGESMLIDNVRFYSHTGSSMSSTPFKLFYIDSAWNRVFIGSFIAGAYNQWRGPDTANPSNIALAVPVANARYLLINCYGNDYPSEMELYGTYVSPTAISVVPAKTVTLGQEMGINAFSWDFESPFDPSIPDTASLKGMKTFTGFRHYLDWDLLEPSEGGYTFNPSHSGGWNLDTLYSTCQQQGILVLADIKLQPGYMTATYPSGERESENVPVRYGADFSDPESYIDQAKLAFQFAGRYGDNTGLSSSLLSVDGSTRWYADPANVVRVGMGVVKYMECDNERDKWWKGRPGYQTGREYAANLSAFYDGHMNTMGTGVGVKNADPSMKVVMAGVAAPTTDWLMGMIDWCREYRGYNTDGSVNVCWDVINYHVYPSTSDTAGAAPEVAHMDSVASAFINVAHTYLNDMPIWMTETGYDTNQHSSQRAIPIGAKTVQQTQADWILRNSLLYARMGIDRVFFYMADDVNPASWERYSSSRLLNPDHSRTPAADYLYQANHLIGNYVYRQTISTNPLVDEYTYDGDTVYVLVSPTQSGASVSYSLNVGTSGTAYIYTPVAGQDSMSLSTAPATGGSVSLTVTETPIFVSATRLNQTAERPGKTITHPANIPASQSEVYVYPNPTTGTATLSLNSAYTGDVKLTLSSEAGVVYNTFTISKTADAAQQSIDMKALPAGIYLLNIVQGKEQTARKIIKLNQ